MSAISVSAAFDSGNIDVVSAEDAGNIRLKIRPDNASDFMQWFHFRVTGAAGQQLVMHIENAGDCAFVGGWENYQACMSVDREEWVRAETDYKDGVLTITADASCDSMYFAYFAPYSHERHLDLVATCQWEADCRHVVLGQTLDGRDMDLLEIGTPGKQADGRDKPVIWVVARQHPGETMAEWCIEGMLDRLFDPADPLSRALLEKAVIYAVPNMNPDGSCRGNLRTNASGANLNREWQTPSMEASPEIFLVRQKMLETGCDLFLDMHGDEALPFVFPVFMNGAEKVTDHQRHLFGRWNAIMSAANPDWQSARGYPAAPPNPGSLRMASNWVGTEFGCLSLTLELPFKDNDNAPDPDYGWSPARSQCMGASCLDGIWQLLPELKSQN